MSCNKILRNFIALISLVVSTSLQAEMPSIPPEVLAKLKDMSPGQQRALAKQYGFDPELVLGRLPLPGNPGDERAALGAPGDPLEQVQRGDSEESLVEQLQIGSDEEENTLERFGASLFDSGISSFEPVDNIPVPEGYRLGVGDELQLMLVGKEEGDFPLLIDRDGSVTLPKLGRIILSGLSFPEAKMLIEKRVSQSLIGSEAILSMGSLRSINVFMAGEVKRPGNYSISALSTLSQSIFIAGGIADTGSYRALELKRQGKTVKSFDLYDLLLSGDNSSDIRLQSGDVVFVPVVGPQASIAGEVVRPAIYEFKMGDSIDSLLKMAGGVLATGNSQQAFLKRYISGTPLPSIDNLNLLNTDSLEKQLANGDSLTVARMSERVSNPIAISGNTDLEELIGWTEGLRVADVFTNLDADVEPTADLNLSLIVRRKNSLNDISVLAFSLTDALLSPYSEDNIELRPFDSIIILPQPVASKDLMLEVNPDGAGTEGSRDDQAGNTRVNLIAPIVKRLEQQSRAGERAQVIKVTGAVREPGKYPLIGDGSIAEVVALAGGYTDAAYLERVEVRRILVSESQEAEVEILDVNLIEGPDSFKLVGRDTLQINSIPNWSIEDTVTLSGEFMFPGTYTISKGETLANLIDRAGGFTREAFLKGAQYYSSAARASQAVQLKKISENMKRRMASRDSAGDMEGNFAATSIQTAIDEELLGRVVIDLEEIQRGNSSANAIVGNGDTLFIPKYSNTIAVVGQVYEPGTFRFEEGATLEQYVQIAGGTTNYALRKNIYLLKADGSVRYYRSNRLRNILRFNDWGRNEIEAGDAIVIPTNLDYDKPLSRASAITSVIFQSLTSIAAFLNIAS